MEDDEDRNRRWPGIDVDSLETRVSSGKRFRKDADPLTANRGRVLRRLRIRAEREARRAAGHKPVHLRELPHRAVETNEVLTRDFMDL